VYKRNFDLGQHKAEAILQLVGQFIYILDKVDACFLEVSAKNGIVDVVQRIKISKPNW
jgi:hypothetical protein